MASPLVTGLYYALGLFFILFATIMIIKSRYRKYTNREFVLFFRNGQLRSKSYGGGYFLLPIIDQIIILTTTVQNLEIDVAEKIITSENQDVRVSGFVVWRIEDPVKAYQSIAGGHTSNAVMGQLNKILEDLVESIVRTTVASLSLNQVLRERGLIIEAIMTELVPVIGPMGIKINTAEIKHIEILDSDLFHDLQEKYRQEARLKAEQTKIIVNKQIAESRASSEEDVRRRELEKEKAILISQQAVDETEEKRRISVEQLVKEREAKIAEMDKKKLEIEASTRLMEKEYLAESRKIEIIRQQIEVEAAKQTKLAEADAEAIKTRAKARKEAAYLDAEAEAVKISKIAEATREALLAEAEGRKALLLAEAEGLREKVKAQGFVNDAMILQELVKQLPNIASSMKVGDINWLQMGNGTGKAEDTPLGIIPKNILQVMALSKSFGLDIENLVRTVRGQSPNPKSKNGEVANSSNGPKVFDRDALINAVAVDLDNDGDIDGFDIDGDGNIDFTLPSGITPVLNKSGQIKGFDLSGNGKADFDIPEIIKAIDSEGDGEIDGLSLDGDDQVDIELKNLLLLQ